MDIFQALKHDHEEIKKMFGEMEGTHDGRKQRAIFDELSKELKSHIKLEEKHFYKMAMEMEDLRMEILEGVEEHGLILRLHKELARATDGDVWMAKLMVMRELIMQHVKHEERELFPKAKKMMEKDMQKEVGMKYEKEHEKMAA